MNKDINISWFFTNTLYIFWIGHSKFLRQICHSVWN